jgi:hypothetical protein
MSPNPLIGETPGRRPFYLVVNGFQLPVVYRYSPLFTAVLVHIWSIFGTWESGGVVQFRYMLDTVAPVRG